MLLASCKLLGVPDAAQKLWQYEVPDRPQPRPCRRVVVDPDPARRLLWPAAVRRVSEEPRRRPEYSYASAESMVESGLLERRRYNEHPPRDEYVLTERGRDFRPVLLALLAWGNRHFALEGAAVQLGNNRN